MSLSLCLPRRGLAGLLAALAALLVIVAPAPATAHPFGAPQTVAIEGDDDMVRVRWRVGSADDLTVLAVALDLVPDSRIMMDGAIVPSYADGTLLAQAPAFADYLTRRIRVSSGGSGCAGRLEPVDHVGPEGVALDFTCPGPVDADHAVDVSVRTLTDLDPAYRILATGPDGQHAVYSADDDTHPWALDATGATPVPAPDAPGRGVVLPVGVAGAILLASVAGGLVWLRRRGRRA